MNSNQGFVSIQAIILGLIVVIAGTTVFLGAINAQVTARDEKRTNDISQISAALKLFYDENGYFPASSGSNMPKGMSDYLDYWPQAPAPEKGCTEIQNTYNYSTKFSGQDYALSFCLGENSGNISFGPHTLSSRGID